MSEWRKASGSVSNSNCVEWRKSRRSEANGACIEIAESTEVVLVRDSKNQEGSILEFNTKSWREFIDAIQRGEFV